MNVTAVLNEIEASLGVVPLELATPYADEVHVTVRTGDFNALCRALHKRLTSPVMMLFAVDERHEGKGFGLSCVFESALSGEWLFVKTALPSDRPVYPTLSKDIYSANLFEREMQEMFGITPVGSPDRRRLHLHDEVWPEGYYPLRKDFTPPAAGSRPNGEYRFRRIEGKGVFEVPVGPVHAGIIGPGHFRFSVAGEPVISLELRLGFTHRGVEKLFEGKSVEEACGLAECVSGDAAFAHRLAFCVAAEKIRRIAVPAEAACLRAVFLELERMYNHVAGIGGIALDVGFSFPSAFASVMKETLLALNEQLTGSRYLKGINVVGGLAAGLKDGDRDLLFRAMDALTADMGELKKMLYESVSFMDRVDTTGTLTKSVADDLGVRGLAGRACGISRDLRKDFSGVYAAAGFVPLCRTSGDVAARLAVRIEEFEQSACLVKEFAAKAGTTAVVGTGATAAGSALGYAEGWRGPVLYWLKTDAAGRIERCKITDVSFRNWQGLAHAVPGNIVPDFPVCNKSFDLSYPGNDL